MGEFKNYAIDPVNKGGSDEIVVEDVEFDNDNDDLHDEYDEMPPVEQVSRRRANRQDDAGSINYSDSAFKERLADDGIGPAFIVGWLLAGILMGPLGLLVTFLVSKDTPNMKMALAITGIGALLSIALVSLLYLLILPQLLMGWAENLVISNQTPVAYVGA